VPLIKRDTKQIARLKTDGKYSQQNSNVKILAGRDAPLLVQTCTGLAHVKKEVKRRNGVYHR
jgi:hypothetical protein